ncbi:MAG: hypothetical protein Q7K55_00370 [Candidatus Levybacteria bacterium]|nr:hypothetical protein [Candidatus Levybacteria bacterium]
MDTSIRRGIDLENRLWDRTVGKSLKNKIYWKGKPINKITLIGLFFVFCVNIFFISSIFSKDLVPAFSSSVFLTSVGGLFESLNILKMTQFFLIISVLSLSFSPICAYLFFRRMSDRHEITALIATLFFILPNPFVGDKSSLAYGILMGDGPHIVVFSFLPLFLLYFRSFIATGLFVWGTFAIIGTSLIAVISPFGLFNLLIFFLIITASESFMGNLRIKFARLLFVLIFSFCLSYFWYNHNLIRSIFHLKSFGLAWSYFIKMFPILIPVVPVVGVISFLIFDRRKKLKPVFIGIFLFVSYLVFLNISSSVSSTGIFMPERYAPELALSKAFLAGLILSFLYNFLILKLKQYKEGQNKKAFLNTPILIIIVVVVTLSIFAMSFYKMGQEREDIENMEVSSMQSLGVGSVNRGGFTFDLSSYFSVFVSVSTFIFLIYLLKFNPLNLKNKISKEERELENT